MKMSECLLLSCCLLLALNGCSVGMAMSGKKNPNLGAIQVGSSRGEVELHLGKPIKSVTLDEGKRMDIYEYEIGNEPSAGRAIGHGVMDILTFGIWEVIGTPIEGVQGDKYEMTLTYDRNDEVEAINKTVKKKKSKKSAKNEHTVKVKVIGVSDEKNDGLQKDRKEAILDAKRQACERAGVKISSKTSIKDMSLYEEKNRIRIRNSVDARL